MHHKIYIPNTDIERDEIYYAVFCVDKIDRRHYALHFMFPTRQEAIEEAKVWNDADDDWNDYEYIVCKLEVLGDKGFNG